MNSNQPATTATEPDEQVAHQFVDWTARAAIAAPLLAVFAIAVGAPLYTQDMRTAAATTRLIVANAATLGVLLLLTVALVGLHLHAADRLRAPGQVAFVGALIGTVLAAGGAWDSLFALPYIAEQAPGMLDDPTAGTLLTGFVVSYLVLVIGWASFAIASLRAGVLPRTPAIVLTVSAVLAILPAPTALRLVPLAVGAALAGRALLSARRDADHEE
jgi:hypothetical protein